MIRINVSLTPEEREKLRKLAESLDRSESNTARLIIKEALENTTETKREEERR